MKKIMKKLQKQNISSFIILFIFIFLNFIVTIISQTEITYDPPRYEIHIFFGKTGLNTLYCDDNIEIYDTENINYYKIDENNNKININSYITKNSAEGFCQYPIKYNVNSIDEKIIIEIIGSPKKLKQLFADSHIKKIERFDYSFPIDETDMNGMFYHCTELEYVDLSNFTFSNTKDVSKMFYSCPKLTKIIFPVNAQSNNIEDFSDMFSFSTELKTVNLSSFSFQKAKNMGYMFNGCTKIENIIFSKNEVAQNVEIFSDMFSSCKNLISLDLSGFSFKTMRNMAYMFNGCTNLVSIKFPTNEKATNIQHIKYMFAGCSNLKSIDMSGLSFVNIVDINSLFNGCSSLETLILPQNETATNIQDFSLMFYGCWSLKEIDLSNIDFANAKKLSYMFYQCKSLENIQLHTSVKATKVENYQSMFLYCENLKTIDLSNFSFTRAKDLSAMFLYCSNLETLILPKDELATNVEDISYMFAICFKIKRIDLSGISFTKIKDMSYLFSNCISLETIIYPDDIETSYNIENIAYLYANCHQLTTIDLSKFNFEKVEDLSYLFFSCINLENIIPPTTSMNNIKIMEHTFDNCTKLQSIDLSNINMESILNFGYAFNNCKNLNNIKVNQNEEIKNIITMEHMFSNCISLTSLNLNQFYINNNVNLNYSFSNCASLKELFIWNIKTNVIDSNFLFNILNGDSLERCLYHSYDNINIGDSITNKICSQYIGYHKCGPCINTNDNEYCIMNVDGVNLQFYYLDVEVNLPIEDRQCFWSKNYQNVACYMFLNNTKKNRISYFIDYCDNFCEICSDNRYGCLQCKNNLYPIDIEFNEYRNGYKSYFFCYNMNDMSNYYFNPITEQFMKCAEKCLECLNGVDSCSKCNNEKGFYKVEGREYECWKTAPTDNWVFDISVKEWRKCNDRCKKCRYQSNSEIDHQCLKCNSNYYSYLTDYLNFEKGIKLSLNCYTKEEVKSENENYFLNGNYFEKCDESCAQCETKKDNCLKCQMNHFNIYPDINGTCFRYPLEKYSVSQIGGISYYIPCFHLCKFCNQVSQSFLYQQCYECDEINYTKDFYSLNQSFCIPLILKNNYVINEDKKWYIPYFPGMEDLIIKNQLYQIDYQRLLKSEKYKNLNYIIVDECPLDKPYIIFSTRQCVSSCSSNNLLEFGLFMTEKMYEYNNICYNECPHGSIKDNTTFTCKEINEYLKLNTSLTKKLYESTEIDYILKYLGDDYAKKTIQSIRASDFSVYHHETKADVGDDTIERMKDLKVPIFIFSECLSELRNNYKLNESENIFVEIIENDSDNSYLNKTSYKFFKEDGQILNHSICYEKNLTMTVMKNIDTKKIDISFLDIIEYLRNSSYNISDPEFCDLCETVIINNTDYTVNERESLAKKAKKLCDDNCEYITFDFMKNYSICTCKMIDEDKTVPALLEDKVKNLDFMEKLMQLKDEGNWEYFFYCYYKLKSNRYIAIPIILITVIFGLFTLNYFICYTKCINIYINILRHLNQNDDDDNNNIDNIFNNYEIIDDYSDARNEEHNLKITCKIYWEYLKQKLIIFIFLLNRNDFENITFKMLKIIIFFENFIFVTTYLFTDKYISIMNKIKENNFEYAFTKEFDRIFLIIFLSYIINVIIFFFFDGFNKLAKARKEFRSGLDIQKYRERLIYLKKVFAIKFLLGYILLFILHLGYYYFIAIFCSIFKNSIKYAFIFFVISLVEYLLIYCFILLIATLLRYISLKTDYQFFEYIFKLSVTIADIL